MTFPDDGAAARPTTTVAPIANTVSGKLRGELIDGVNVFKGIRYAASTAGVNRWRKPQPVQPWSGLRDALTYPSMAPQHDAPITGLFASWTDPTTPGEDCLGLNVWTPGLRDGAKRPVMVWFHGGGFFSQSGSRLVFDGKRLARRGDVVLITVNHRLNSFGFLYLGQLLPELAEAANPGMLDLVAALRWVRDNIAEFGGDPGNVTIFGQSGGGAKVATVMAMPAAKGLFHRAIIQSGTYARTAHLEAITPEIATGHAHTYLAAAGLKPAEARKLLDMPMAALIEANRKATQSKTPPVWQPVQDGTHLPSGPSWPTAPAISADVPLMIGSTANEMNMLIGMFDPSVFDLDEAGLRKRVSDLYASDKVDEVIATFRANQPGASPASIYFDIATATVFRRGAWTHADLKFELNQAPVWLYEIDWAIPVGDGRWGSPHSMEHPFVFDNVALSESMVGTLRAAPQAMADQISPTWVAFARTGNPNNPAIPYWPAYSAASRTTMVFDTNSKALKHFREDERKLVQYSNGYEPPIGPQAAQSNDAR